MESCKRFAKRTGFFLGTFLGTHDRFPGTNSFLRFKTPSLSLSFRSLPIPQVEQESRYGNPPTSPPNRRKKKKITSLAYIFFCFPFFFYSSAFLHQRAIGRFLICFNLFFFFFPFSHIFRADFNILCVFFLCFRSLCF